jgi:hypothetical protein
MTSYQIFELQFYPDAKTFWPTFDGKGTYPSITLHLSETPAGKLIYQGFTMPRAESMTFDGSKYNDLLQAIISLLNERNNDNDHFDTMLINNLAFTL